MNRHTFIDFFTGVGLYPDASKTLWMSVFQSISEPDCIEAVILDIAGPHVIGRARVSGSRRDQYLSNRRAYQRFRDRLRRIHRKLGVAV